MGASLDLEDDPDCTAGFPLGPDWHQAPSWRDPVHNSYYTRGANSVFRL